MHAREDYCDLLLAFELKYELTRSYLLAHANIKSAHWSEILSGARGMSDVTMAGLTAALIARGREFGQTPEDILRDVEHLSQLVKASKRGANRRARLREQAVAQHQRQKARSAGVP